MLEQLEFYSYKINAYLKNGICMLIIKHGPERITGINEKNKYATTEYVSNSALFKCPPNVGNTHT